MKQRAKETAKEVSGPKEFLLSDNELDNLTDIEWPDEYINNEDNSEEDYNIVGHQINNDEPQFYLQFTGQDEKNSGWYAAINTFQDYPQMTATFMLQMELNMNKDWEGLWKKIDKKLWTKCP